MDLVYPWRPPSDSMDYSLGRRVAASFICRAVRPMLPSAEAEPERYRGRPLLIVLENYILAAIGELPTAKEADVARVVQTVFGGGADWMETVRNQLRLGDSLNASLRSMWQGSQATAIQQGLSLHPIQFAKMVADQNFAEMIGPPLGS